MSNLVLYADDLLSKWGFSDGDRLSDWVYDRLNRFDFEYDNHKVLEELVKRYLLPKLDKKVEIYFISTIHNPVRAEMIDGEYYTNHYEHDDNGLLGDVQVEITLEQFLEVAKDFGWKLAGKKNSQLTGRSRYGT
jgi:major membrane immunogen (membrane-anchored lipoprotein)